jgi:hypothetical protein
MQREHRSLWRNLRNLSTIPSLIRTISNFFFAAGLR